MANFCSKCGVKNTSEDKFCKDCGAKLAGTAEAPREEVKSEQPSAPESTPATPAKIPTKTKVHAIVQAIISLFLLGLFTYWASIVLGCAQGRYRGNGDVGCQSIYDFFNSSSPYVTPGGNPNGGGSPLCINRCPAYAPYHCAGQYYDSDGIQRSLNGCLPTTASQAGYSSWTGICTKCP